MKPLIYGYIRVPDGMDDQEVRSFEKQLTTFATVEGFTLGSIFYEYDTGSLAAFAELVTELRRSEAHDVVVPSLEQVADNPYVQASLVATVELRADAVVHEVPRP